MGRGPRSGFVRGRVIEERFGDCGKDQVERNLYHQVLDTAIIQPTEEAAL